MEIPIVAGDLIHLPREFVGCVNDLNNIWGENWLASFKTKARADGASATVPPRLRGAQRVAVGKPSDRYRTGLDEGRFLSQVMGWTR